MTARSSWFSIIRLNHFRRTLARSLAVFLRQAGQAALAASIARRVSAVPMFGIVPRISPVAGLVTSIVFPESASTHLLSMKHCCRNRLLSLIGRGAAVGALAAACDMEDLGWLLESAEYTRGLGK